MVWDLVIFDCDGVLVDSEPASNRATVESLAEVGLDITFKESERLFKGRSMDSILVMVEERMGRPVPKGFVERLYERMDEAFKKELEVIPGIVGVLDELDRLAVPTCVASSGPHRKMRTTLGLTGLSERFEGRIFSAADVGRGKPFPDLFLHAARSMKADPVRCAVVEDSLPGVRAGLAAGMSVYWYSADRTAVGQTRELAGARACPFHSMTTLPELLGV